MATVSRREEEEHQSVSRAGVEQSVLLVGTFLSSTLSARGVCEDLAVRLPPLGWRVLTTSTKSSRLSRFLDMVGTTWRERNEYAVAQVDVYSGAAFSWAEAVCWTLRMVGKPYLLVLRGGDLPAFARRWPRRVKHLLQSAAAVTTPSPYLREQMSPYRADLLLQHNPLDLNRYNFRRRERPQPRLIWLRAFHETYNPSLAPRVVALLAQDIPDVHLIMVGRDKGDGSLQAMQRTATALGVSTRIDLPGGVSKAEVSEWMNKGDIFLNTTNVDNTPISVLEAMACGLCVVSTNVGGIPYLLKHEHTALLIPPDDPEAMAAAVRRLLTEPGLAARLSQNGRREAEQFDWSLVLPHWDSLLKDVAAGH